MSATVTPEKGAEMLRRFGREALKALLAAGRAASLYATRVATTRKLRGQVLNRRTGTLIRNVAASGGAQTAGNSAVGAWIGTSLGYGIAHEQGFSGPVGVRAHTRLSRRGGAHLVRAHQRFVKIRARRYLRDSTTESSDAIARLADEAMDFLAREQRAPTAGELLRGTS